MVTKRDSSFRMLLTAREREQLDELAESDGVNAADVLRRFIRTEHEKRFGKPQLKPKK